MMMSYKLKSVYQVKSLFTYMQLPKHMEYHLLPSLETFTLIFEQTSSTSSLNLLTDSFTSSNDKCGGLKSFVSFEVGIRCKLYVPIPRERKWRVSSGNHDPFTGPYVLITSNTWCQNHFPVRGAWCQTSVYCLQ